MLPLIADDLAEYSNHLSSSEQTNAENIFCLISLLAYKDVAGPIFQGPLAFHVEKFDELFVQMPFHDRIKYFRLLRILTTAHFSKCTDVIHSEMASDFIFFFVLDFAL